MSLARIKTWIAGDTLTAADLNAEFNNPLNNPISLISPTTGVINFDNKLHTNLPVSALSGTSGSTGQVATIDTAAGAVVWKSASGGSIAPYAVHGLIGSVTTSQTASFSADQYLLRTTSTSPANVYVTATSAYTINVGTAGSTANGRDQAGVFSSTWVYWYAISTGTNSTAPQGLVSQTGPPTGPTLPTSYNSWVFLAASPYTSASTQLSAAQRVQGAMSFYEAQQNALSGGTATSETAISLVTLVAPNALGVLVNADLDVTAGTAVGVDAARLRVVSTSDYRVLRVEVFTANADNSMEADFTCPNVSQQLLYLLDTAVNTRNLDVNIIGYKNPNGDV